MAENYMPGIDIIYQVPGIKNQTEKIYLLHGTPGTNTGAAVPYTILFSATLYLNKITVCILMNKKHILGILRGTTHTWYQVVNKIYGADKS